MLYEILKARKTGIAPDLWTMLRAKNYGGSSAEWHTVTDTPPITINSDGTDATVTIYGNMAQSGTPTPTTPIQPQECGERTENLVEEALMSCNIQADGTLIGNSSFNMFIAKIKQGQTYSLDNVFVGGFFASKPTIGAITYNNAREVTNRTYFIAPIDGYVAFRKNSTETTAMLNTGSTALPYEPYGIKIPILSANTTTPVYLGEVESTRKIYKTVLTGQESWAEYGTGTGHFYYMALSPFAMMNIYPVCSHYTTVRVASEGKQLRVYETYESTTAFTTYLQQQYAAGTPVTVWYVLATPQTAVVNEPIRKIGDYADSVSGITIPTAVGSNTIDVDTTLKPSEMTIQYKG